MCIIYIPYIWNEFKRAIMSSLICSSRFHQILALAFSRLSHSKHRVRAFSLHSPGEENTQTDIAIDRRR